MTQLRLTIFAYLIIAAAPAHGANLYQHDDWSALASDHQARQVGDALTVIVYESATANNSATTSSTGSMAFGGQISAGSSLDEFARLSVDSGSENAGSTGRTGAMVAQISVLVQEVLPNGDLRVAGDQVLNINGERTKIRVSGRVRRIDISASNVVLSSRLADAMIDYDGVGFVSNSAQPGIVTRIFRWLGFQ